RDIHRSSLPWAHQRACCSSLVFGPSLRRGIISVFSAGIKESHRVDSWKRPILTMNLVNMIQANTPIKPRLLVLDEDRIILQSLAHFLRREGYEVRTTDSPDDALGILESNPVELLLADINMPGIKPADFLRDIRRRFPHVVIVVITGY